tara:strand:- start:135 stop:659 length:525 start_codon:yes stop_codon:yes gene_type:complete
MSQLKVNSIVPAGGLPSGANGGIIQVVTSTKTDTFSSTTAGSFLDISLNATITPQSNSSNILILASVNCAGSDTGLRFMTGIFRGSTQIAQGDASSSRQRCSWQGVGTHANAQHSVNHNFIDTGISTTSATTYHIKLFNEASGYNVYVNRSHTDGDSSTHGRSISSITLMELGG